MDLLVFFCLIVVNPTEEMPTLVKVVESPEVVQWVGSSGGRSPTKHNNAGGRGGTQLLGN